MGRCKERGRKGRTCDVKMDAGMQEVIMQHLSRVVISFMLLVKDWELRGMSAQAGASWLAC